MSRVVVHRWFALTFSDTGDGDTKIAVKEHLGLGPSWWVPGVAAALFIGVATTVSGHFMARATLIGIAFMQVMAFLISIVATATATMGDRDRLSSLLARVARTREAA